jgi:hypothetical protein
MEIAAYAEDLSESTGIGPTAKVTASWSSSADDEFLILYSATLGTDTTTNTVDTYLNWPGAYTRGPCSINSFRGIGARHSVSGAWIDRAATDWTWELVFQRTAGGGNAIIKYASIAAIKIRPGVDYAATGNIGTAGDPDYNQACAITVTAPSPSLYLIMAFGQYMDSGAPANTRVTIGGTPIDNSTAYQAAPGNYTPYALARLYYFSPAATTTMALQSQGRIEDGMICAIKLNTNAAEALLGAVATTTSTTEQIRSTLDASALGKPHIIIGNSFTALDTVQFLSSRGPRYDFRDNTASETFQFTDYRPLTSGTKFMNFSFLKRTLAAGARTYYTRYWRVGAGTPAPTVSIESSNIILVPLVRRVSIDGVVVNVDQ